MKVRKIGVLGFLGFLPPKLKIEKNGNKEIGGIFPHFPIFPRRIKIYLFYYSVGGMRNRQSGNHLKFYPSHTIIFTHN